MSSLRNYLEIFIIFISVSIIYYYPNYLIEVLIALYATIFVDLIIRNIKIPAFSVIEQFYENFESYRLEKRIEKILKKEELEEYRQQLIEINILKVKSKDEIARKMGFIQLGELGGNETCEKLIEILKDPLDKKHEKQILENLCKICKKSNYIV